MFWGSLAAILLSLPAAALMFDLSALLDGKPFALSSLQDLWGRLQPETLDHVLAHAPAALPPAGWAALKGWMGWPAILALALPSALFGLVQLARSLSRKGRRR